jgi:hypothetical protein
VNPSPVEYREDLDAGLLKIASICVLAAVMASLDTTVVSVAQRTFITEFHTSQAVVAWTMTGNTLALATVIPLTGWAANRFGTRRLLLCPKIIHSSRATAPAGELDELTPDRPAWTDRFSGEQIAGNASAVRRIPLDARVAVGLDEPRHDAEHGPR